MTKILFPSRLSNVNSYHKKKKEREKEYAGSQFCYCHECSCIIEFIKRVGKKIRCEALPSILSVFPNEFNKFNNTGARMQDCIYHMTLKSHFISKFCNKTSRFRHSKTRRFYGRQRISLGQTKLIPWSSDFVFENKERASELFIFVQKISSIILWSERMFIIIIAK